MIERRAVVRVSLVAVCLSVLTVSLSFSQDKPARLPEARAAVDANWRSCEGQAYDRRIAREFRQNAPLKGTFSAPLQPGYRVSIDWQLSH